MDLGSYLLDGIVESTAPANETPAAARVRSDAILQMVQAFDPRSALEGMIACHCVTLQLMLNGAVRDSNDTNLKPGLQAKARAAGISTSRTLLQWFTKFENTQKRDAAEAQQPVKTRAAPVPVPRPAAERRPPDAPPYRPVPADRLDVPPPPNGHAAAVVAPTPSELSPANGSRQEEPGPAVIALSDRTT